MTEFAFQHIERVICTEVLEIPKSILKETYRYADSIRYMSWEEYYTYYLTDKTRNGIAQYGKSRLADYYKTEGAVRKIAAVLPKEIKGD